MRGLQLIPTAGDDWSEPRLGSLLEPVSRPVIVDPEEEYQPLGIRSYGLGIFRKERTLGADLGDSDFFWVAARDLIFSGQFAWEGAIALAGEDDEGCVVSHRYPIYRVRTDLVDERFLLYFFRTPVGQFLLRENSFGAAGRNRPLNDARLLKERVPLPPLPQQKHIAAYLDRKLAAVAGVLNKHEELLDCRQRLIYSTVTRGLRRNVALKASGIPTIGDIPEHWRIARNKTVMSEVVDLSTTGDEELLTVSHITGVTRRSDKTVTMFLAESNEGYKRARAGDLVINTMWAWMGALGIAPEDGIVSPAYGVYRLDKSQLLPDFYDLFLRTKGYVAEMTRESKGVWSSRLRLYPDSFLALSIPVPPMREQVEIVDRLKSVEFTRRLRAADDLLQQYRHALIAAAVTGSARQARGAA
jgi:type I restriction enzyme S subunit